METPHLPRALFEGDFLSVYEPAEDTFLLLDALELDLDSIKENTTICLECGSGSGTIITALSKAFADQQQRDDDAHLESTVSCPKPLMLATDINPRACLTTRKCANYHNQDNNIQIVQTNLAESLVDRLENSVDLLIFNPPYVPTDDDEQVATSGKSLQMAWAGGAGGRKLIDIFLESYVPRLMSRPNGAAYMVALDRNDVDDLLEFLKTKHNIRGTVVMKRCAGIESLCVVKYTWVIT